ncbi:MAG: hypothetical protein ACI91B_003934, partial [Planctomycetota bacterium]
DGGSQLRSAWRVRRGDSDTSPRAHVWKERAPIYHELGLQLGLGSVRQPAGLALIAGTSAYLRFDKR